MNPFDLRGPQFLVFYLFLTLVTVIVLGVLRRRRELELSPGSTARLHDPYAIAYLRGGTSELVRVAIVSLVDRTLLSVGQDKLTRTPIGRDTEVRKRIEKELLAFCATPRDPSELFEGDTFQGSALEYDYELAKLGLVPNDDIQSARRRLFLGAAAVLLFFSLTKIVVAFGRGRTNVALLISLTVVALWLARKTAFPHQTSRGKQFLAELRNLFKSLKERVRQIRPGGANADLVLALAVFGLSVMPWGFSWVQRMFPKASSSSSGSCGSSCGSSSSSGCGSSGCGSSGCGGGGCGGGGCGGCGG